MLSALRLCSQTCPQPVAFVLLTSPVSLKPVATVRQWHESCPIVGSNESCDRAVKLVGSWEFLFVLFNKMDGQSYWCPLSIGFDSFGNQLSTCELYLRGTIRGDPQISETLCRVRSPILFVCSVILMCNHNEAERSVWVIGPSSGRDQQYRN